MTSKRSGSVAPTEPYTNLTVLPPPTVLIGHTGGPFCDTPTSCCKVLRSIQSYHMRNKNFIDIGYNFLVGGDGAVYEGRGWDVWGAHTRGYNFRSICVGFVGDYKIDEPTDTQLETLQKFLEFGLGNNKLKQDYKLFGQCQVAQTDSPGEKLFARIKKFKRWSPDSKVYCDFETGIEFVRRSEWGAADPSESRENLGVLPPPFVIIGHTVTRFCSTRSECKETVWRIQRDHMNSSKPSFYNDIAYNFLVGGDGAVYEGRGWDVRGAHTKPYNDKSLGLAFVGNYNEVRPTLTQLEVTKKLLDYGVRHNKLKDTHVVFGQCQVQRKESPGKKLYEEIKKWEHWSPKSEFECVFNATF